MLEFPETLVADEVREPEQTTLRERRTALLDAAERLLAAGGLLPVGLQEIGAAAGLPPYAVRAQFGNKQMVIEAVLERHLNRLIERLGVYRRLDDTEDAVEKLVWAIRDLLEMLGVYREAQRVFAAAVSGASPALGRALQLRQRHLADFYAGLIVRAVPETAGRTEILMPLTMTLMASASGHILWFREGAALSREAYARLLAHMVVDGARAAAASGLGSAVSPAAKRARLRAAAAAHVAAYGLAGLALPSLATAAGIKFDLARWYYRTNGALLADVVREFQAGLGERMAHAVLAARRLAGRQRVEALSVAYLEAVAAERTGFLTARAACVAFPEVRATAAPGEAWLVEEFSDAAGCVVRGRTILAVLGEWGARLAADDAAGRGVCAAVVGGMVGPATGAPRER